MVLKNRPVKDVIAICICSFQKHSTYHRYQYICPNELRWVQYILEYYSDVIMLEMVSQIASLTIVYSTVYSGVDQRKHQSFTSLAFVRGNYTVTGEFPAQMASNPANVSVWRSNHRQYVSVCSDNGILTPGSKPSPESMLTEFRETIWQQIY